MSEQVPTDLSRRDFLKLGVLSVASGRALVGQPQPEPKFYAHPDEQTWLSFESPVAPYEIQHPFGWTVFSDMVRIGSYSEGAIMRGVRADIFGGGILGKTTMKLLIATENLNDLSKRLDQKITPDDYIKLAQEDRDLYSQKAETAEFSSYREYEIIGGIKVPSFGVFFQFLGLEKFFMAFVVHELGWRMEFSLTIEEFLLSKEEYNNIGETIRRMWSSFTLK